MAIESQSKMRFNGVRELPNRLGRMMRRFTLGADSKERVERWQNLARHGEALERIMSSDDWGAVEEAQQVFLRLRDQALRTPSISEVARHDAAVEWCALDGFFRELRQRVKEGRSAREALSKCKEKAQS